MRVCVHVCVFMLTCVHMNVIAMSAQDSMLNKKCLLTSAAKIPSEY